MDKRPVSVPKYDPASWRLAPGHAENTQGLVVSGFSDCPVARALFLKFEPRPDGKPLGGAWLKALTQAAPVTVANGKGKDTRSAAISFTWLGLREIGLDDSSLASFDRPFKEGMFQEDRLRRLGDRPAWPAVR